VDRKEKKKMVERSGDVTVVDGQFEIEKSKQELDMWKNVLAIATARDQYVEKAIEIALKSTNHKDWSNFGGNPWLEASGVEKIARRFGITFGRYEWKKVTDEDSQGSFYTVVVEGPIYLTERDSLWATGTAGSRDKFFVAMAEKHDGVVDFDDILKKAISNWEVNGVTRLLGLRSCTWEMVSDAGVQVGLIEGVEFEGKEKREEKKKSGEMKSAPDMRVDIVNTLKENHRVTDGDKIGLILEKVTEFKAKDRKTGEDKIVPGLRDISMLGGKRLFVVWQIVTEGKYQLPEGFLAGIGVEPESGGGDPGEAEDQGKE
jgi:hypothetical protein